MGHRQRRSATVADAATSARDVAAAAETARVAAAEAARQVARELQPVSVLISRKPSGFMSVRHSSPSLKPGDNRRSRWSDGQASLRRRRAHHRRRQLRWNVVSLGGGRPPSGAAEPKDRAHGSSGRDVESAPSDADSAKAALDRIVIPQDALNRITGTAPRSSLIVTDEALVRRPARERNSWCC